ncbi:VPS4-associated protein 1 [Scheffersomyces xylosifermentans]|uniref:VPS4-associated protein 1 n=1 Tax=Scheffersomyces xylosifermentans TaxID=1304137 RepID=UPI00315DE084
MSQQKQAPPFENIYSNKKVAEADAKPCLICYKPATTVLLSENKVDFFYTCVLHLQDEHFASALPNEAYNELLKTRDELEKNLEDLKKQMDAVKPYIWNKLMYEYIPGMGQTDKKKDDKDDKGDKKNSESHKSNNEKFKELEQETREKTIKLSEVKIQIAQFRFTSYKLHQDVYRSRLQNYIKIKFNRARNQKIQSDPSFFPSAPTNKLE